MTAGALIATGTRDFAKLCCNPPARLSKVAAKTCHDSEFHEFDVLTAQAGFNQITVLLVGKFQVAPQAPVREMRFPPGANAAPLLAVLSCLLLHHESPQETACSVGVLKRRVTLFGYSLLFRQFTANLVNIGGEDYWYDDDHATRIELRDHTGSQCATSVCEHSNGVTELNTALSLILATTNSSASSRRWPAVPASDGVRAKDLLQERPMFTEVIAAMLSITGVLVSHFVGHDLLQILEKIRRRLSPKRSESYQERMSKLTESLTKASSEVDTILADIQQVTKERELAVKELEARVGNLATEQNMLERKIKTLKDVPLPVVDYLSQITDRSERRSARRDYVLFSAGVIVSAVVSILLRVLGLA